MSHLKDGDGYVSVYEFGSFKLKITRRQFQGPGSTYEVINPRTGKGLDLLSFLPQDWTTEVSAYPFGNGDPQKKRISIPQPVTKGRLFSGMHEMEHAIHRHEITAEESMALDNARVAVKTNTATTEQKQMVIQEERQAWTRVEAKITHIEAELGIKIVEDREAYAAFANRRLSYYESVPAG